MHQTLCVGPYLVRAREVAQTGSHIDGIAKTITCNDFDVATGDPDANGHLQVGRHVQHVLLVAALHLDNGLDSLGAFRKYRQHAVTHGFDHAATIGDTNFTNPPCQTCHDLGRLEVSNRFKDAGTTNQIREYNCRADTHSLNSSLSCLRV